MDHRLGRSYVDMGIPCASQLKVQEDASSQLVQGQTKVRGLFRSESQPLTQYSFNQKSNIPFLIDFDM